MKIVVQRLEFRSFSQDIELSGPRTRPHSMTFVKPAAPAAAQSQGAVGRTQTSPLAQGSAPGVPASTEKESESVPDSFRSTIGKAPPCRPGTGAVSSQGSAGNLLL